MRTISQEKRPTSILSAFLFAAYIIPVAIYSPRIDDAYITFRHSYNLATQFSPCFNLVNNLESCSEAATNTSWMALLAFLGWIFQDASVIPVMASVLSGIFLTFSAYLFLHLLVERIERLRLKLPRNRIYLLSIAIVFIVFNPYLVQALSNGLEAPLLVACLLLAFSALKSKAFNIFSAIAFVAYLTRPEVGLSLALAGSVGFIAIYVYPWTGITGLLLGFTRYFKSWLLFWLPLAALTVTRFAIFGTTLPNSVIAKNYSITRDKGVFLLAIKSSWSYLSSSLLDPASSLYLICLFFLGFSLCFFSRRQWNGRHIQLMRLLLPSLIVFGASLIALVAYIKNGGDWMPGHRLLTQWVPVLAISSLYGFPESSFLGHSFRARWLSIKILSYAAILLIFFLLLFSFNWLYSLAKIEKKPETGAYNAGVFLLKQDSAQFTSGSFEALGGHGWALRGAPIEVHDPLGLASTWLAKNGQILLNWGKSDTEYSLFSVSPKIAVYHYPGRICELNPDQLKKLEDKYIMFEDSVNDEHGATILLVNRASLDGSKITAAYLESRFHIKMYSDAENIALCLSLLGGKASLTSPH
jgi:hypothetical protein